MAKQLADAETSSEQTKSERVYRSLRRRIREFELPPGSRLRKNEIALEYGVSRAPVSEAISRLADEGLVDVFPQSGSFVSPIRPQDIRESMLIRTGLEVEAVRRVALTADSDLLKQLDENLIAQEATLENDDMARLDDLDEAFHLIIFNSIHSPRAQHLLDTARALLDRPRFHALPEDDRPRATVLEHRRIADAIRTGDPEFAGAAMRVHLIKVADAIERELALLEVEDDK
jgi:DNA-binding GntR family transcriptional regulator